MLLITEKSTDYELIDSGVGQNGGEKLERFGTYILRRPDPEVLWKKMKLDEEWNSADVYFSVQGVSKKWKVKEGMKEEWQIELNGLKFFLHLGAFKHVGIFPEQVSNWEWMVGKVESRKSIKSIKSILASEERVKVTTFTSSERRQNIRGTPAFIKLEAKTHEKIKVLNLFGYTGGVSVALAKAGAEVTHVDSAPSAVDWAKKNAELNGISTIRFMVDDVRKFVEREIKRGMKYDAILLDPPVYGKGGKKQSKDTAWHIEEDFLPLLERIKKLLSDTPLFVSVSGYASEYSHLSYANALQEIFPNISIESGELAIKESDSTRLLPAGIFARAIF